jgi:hypothetical protein
MVKMVKQAVLLLSALIFAAACGAERSGTITAVTIEATCSSTAECPAGFECTADIEHGPPTALCESADPDARCPAGYETKALYGQIFCRPPAPIAAQGARAGQPGEATHSRHAGL